MTAVGTLPILQQDEAQNIPFIEISSANLASVGLLNLPADVPSTNHRGGPRRGAP